MFRHLRQWFIKVWHRFLGLFRKPQPTNSPAPQLTDADYEKLFFQLLKVVNSGMGETEVLRCLESLKQRSSEAEWVQWLGRFGDRLLASDAPNRKLAEKMVKLGEVNGGQLTEISGNIGRELLSQCGEEGPVSVDVCEDAKAWFNRGVERHLADDFNGALASYEKAIDIELNYYIAWHNKGAVLRELGHYEEALASFDKVIEIEPKFHEAWNGKGDMLRALGLYEDAIIAFNHALQLTNNQFWRAWLNRGVAIYNLRGYYAAIENWDEGLQNIPAKELEGRAILHQYKGNAHYDYARLSYNYAPRRKFYDRLYPYGSFYEYKVYLKKARNSYIDALKTLSNCQNDILGKIFDQPCPPHLLPLYLEILQSLAKVCKALGNQEEFEHYLTLGDHLLEELLKTESEEQKIILSNKYASFNQLRVLLYAQSLEPEKQEEALNLAEKRKNLCLRWMRDGWVETETPAPSLPTGCAALYWYYTDAGIVVFILRNDRPLKVCILTFQIPQLLDSYADRLVREEWEEENFGISAGTFVRRFMQEFGENLDSYADRLVGEFEEWMKQWQENYEKQRGKKEDQTQSQKWQDSIIPELERLRKILQIDEQILPHLTGIHHLILIPHRHLHLLPLEYFFHNQGFTISRLPSLQIGIDLENSPNSANHLLNVQNPAFLLFADLESDLISHFYQNNQTLITSKKATQENVINHLQTNTGIFHFTGHAGHDFNNPKNSALQLTQNQLLTLEEIFKINFSKYFLINLSACETGLTSKTSITDEYVGLVSGFLSSKASYVVSTLWQVQELSAALIMIEFYREISKQHPPIIALKNAQTWLRTVTLEKLAQWCEELASEIGKDKDSYGTLISQANQAKQQIAIMGKDYTPYNHPYHWSGVIITGKINL